MARDAYKNDTIKLYKCTEIGSIGMMGNELSA